jgi:flagellar hook protein FlgE
MFTALWAGVSGLNAFENALSVIGGNIANVNTVGYKTQHTSFEEILSGVSLGNVNRVFSQGSIQYSTSPTDLAIQGRGFFVLSDGSGIYYSRAGIFNLDNENRLVNPQGLVGQGWQLDSTGKIHGPLGDDILSGSDVPNATKEFAFAANLDAAASDGETHSTSFTIYDSRGGTVTLTLDFTYDATLKQWDWKASAPGATTTSAGSISFDENGQLVPSSTNPTITVTGLGNGAADLSITWKIVKPDGTSDITSYRSSSSTTYISQNGYPSGLLKDIAVNEQGIITGIFSNGQTRDLAQIALADFANPMGLLNLGGNIYSETTDSGQAILGAPKQGGKGSILSESLEMSNVDLATEFVDLILTQRGFQASSRVITASDTLMTEIVNLIR